MKDLWKRQKRRKTEPAEELDRLHRATDELVEHYYAIFEQAVKRGDVSVIGRMH